MLEIDKFEVGKAVTMKKAHPCGGASWEIVRVGADIKLQCKTCGKYINLTRDELKKRAKPQPKDKE
ncbi:MAG: DUF951 domain-containing protein [Clostridia bacterium]|nr:DUF951 domain-containing protein [Clostridia bacterium]